MRRWLWILIVFAVPVPFFAGRGDAAPIALVAALVVRLVTALVQDGGPVTRILTALVAAQALGWIVASWWIAGRIARLSERLAPPRRRLVGRGVAVAAVLVALASGARWLLGTADGTGATTLVPGALVAEPEGATAATPAACAHRTDLRQPFFGDLHVHTTLSFDAAAQDTRTRPRDAYRFARGEPLDLPPYDADGRPAGSIRLQRPLDFAAVTDHAEFLGEMNICRSPDLPGRDSPICRLLRSWPRIAFLLLGGDYISVPDPVRYGFCGPSAETCRAAAGAAWREIRDAAEAAQDRSDACRFSTFVGYEWTLSPGGRNLHRNVLFRDATVPPVPVSSMEAHTPEDLWRALRADCTQSGTGCDAITIPHNSNLSGGLMFLETAAAGRPIDAAYANERARFEPLAEIMQHKGASECLRGGLSTDEECDFEQLPFDSFAAQVRPEMNRPKKTDSYLRGALERGLALEEKLGVNPFKLGFVGGTDTHVTAAGMVEPEAFPGHAGATADARPEDAAVTLPDAIEFNPGGLAVLWAEENSRAALWEALRRRETYATSGPRLTVRFFGGFDYPADLCGSAGLARTGYAQGVAMGGDLPRPSAPGAAPAFVVSALADPGVPGRAAVPLQRVQIVKGWIENGVAHERVVDVAGDAASGADVDPLTCAPHGTGPASLCTVWRDPDFDSREPAFWYARVLESPTCRWNAYACLARAVDCAQDVPPGLEPCCDPEVPRTVQQRAWTSPIWYRPAP